MSVSIRFNAAACVLAQALFYARAQAFNLASPHWEALHVDVRRHYVERAQEMLQKEEPLARSDGPGFDPPARVVSIRHELVWGNGQ